MHTYPRFLPVGDAAMTVEFGDTIDPDANAAVISLDARLAASDVGGVIETVPSYRSLLVRYEPAVTGFSQMAAALRQLARPASSATAAGRRWTVPVAYEAPFATDLADVAAHLGLSPEQVIAAHTGQDYKVYAIGFAPGMPFLGGLPEALHIPRRQSPRPGIPAGAAIIGGMQASIVPVPTLSGWHVLGQTPVRPFDRLRGDPFLFRAGDTVRFRQVSAGDYGWMAALPWDEFLPLLQAPPPEHPAAASGD